MSDIITWIVLSDGRYIKILIDKGVGKQLVVLQVDDVQAYADLCYLMVNGKPLNGTGDLAISKKINNLQFQADFIAEQHELGMFSQMLIGAPQEVLTALRDALPEQVAKLIIGEIAEDLMVMSNGIIEERFADMIISSIEKAS